MITVAIPVLNGSETLPGVLRAVTEQEVDDAIELLVCDSGSVDGSRELALGAGARVLDLAPGTFSHSGTRNLLLQQARGDFVAMLTQDAEPADRRWLAGLLRGFDLADDVGLVFGPYLPRPDCPPREVARLARFFAGISPDSRPRVDRLTREERSAAAPGVAPERAYFTDANGCIRRAAWRDVPFPPAAYAEDHALSVAMLRAGWAKAFVPDAGVLHSHHYAPLQRMRRSFDDWRGMWEVYGWREPLTPAHVVLQLRGAGGLALRTDRAAGVPALGTAIDVLAAAAEHSLHLLGAILGSRADRLPRPLSRWLSLERRGGVSPVCWPAPSATPAPPDRAHNRR